MPLAPALRGQSIRAKADARLVGDNDDYEDVHSVLLMTLSPYFQLVFTNDRHNFIRIHGADREVLKMLKEYAYDGKITGLSKENIKKVMAVADMYNIMGILNECELFVKNNNVTLT